MHCLPQAENGKGETKIEINKVVELEDKTVKFEGTLTPEETQLVVDIGFNFLVRSGAFNVMSRGSISRHKKAKECAI